MKARLPIFLCLCLLSMSTILLAADRVSPPRAEAAAAAAVIEVVEDLSASAGIPH